MHEQQRRLDGEYIRACRQRLKRDDTDLRRQTAMKFIPHDIGTHNAGEIPQWTNQ